MKKYFLMFMIAIIAISCSKKVEVTGKITGGSPLERIEFIEASGVATLPLVNLGIDKNGNFNGSFEAPKEGIYVIVYAQKQNLIYLKGGQKINITGNAATFPSEFKITGEAKNNNDFLLEAQKNMTTYTQKLNIQEKMMGKEDAFLKEIQKIQTELEKIIDQVADKTKADKKVVNWKKKDIRIIIMSLIPEFEILQKQAAVNGAYKKSAALKQFEEKLLGDKDEMVREHPIYRHYLLTKIREDFQKFQNANQGKQEMISEKFNNFMKKRKDFSQLEKDYLLSYIIAQYDLNPTITNENRNKITKIINSDVKDIHVKNDLKKILFVAGGFKKGEEAPVVSLVKEDGKSFSIKDMKGKPTVLMFYASWTPYIKEYTIPTLTETVKLYQSKVNFVFVNFDDTQEQFKKTSKALFSGIKATNGYAEGGLSSDFAKKYGIYGYKLTPGFLVLDKDAKVAGRSFFNLGDPEFISLMEQLSGIKSPQSNPDITLQNNLLQNSKVQSSTSENQQTKSQQPSQNKK